MRPLDLRLLMQLVPANVSRELTIGAVLPLNRYSVEARYPGDWELINREEAESAVGIARQVRDTVRKRLPKGSFQG